MAKATKQPSSLWARRIAMHHANSAIAQIPRQESHEFVVEVTHVEHERIVVRAGHRAKRMSNVTIGSDQ